MSWADWVAEKKADRMPQQFAIDFESRVLARSRDPQTSHLAADAVRQFAAGQHRIILEVLRVIGPLTAHEIAPHTRMDAHQVGKRLGEMERAGWVRLVLIDPRSVRDARGKPAVTEPLTRKTPSGRHARVWEAV